MSLEFLGGFDEDLFVEITASSSRRRATKKERQELCDFIGGFVHWKALDTPLQMHVVSFLDYWTRCNLSVCSKDNNQLINESVLYASETSQKEGGIRLKPKNLAVLCKSDYDQKHRDGIEIERIDIERFQVEIRTTSGMTRSWRYTQHEEKCRVTSKTSMARDFKYSRHFEYEKANAFEECRKKIQKMLEIGSKSVKILTCDLRTVPKELKLVTDKLPKLKVFQLIYGDASEVEYWVSKLCPETSLDKLVLYTHDPVYRYRDWNQVVPLSFDYLNVESIINAKHLEMSSLFVILRGQFLSLKATQMRLRTDTIKFEVLNEYIRRWVDDEISNDFVYCIILSYTPNRPERTGFYDFGYTQHHDWRNSRSPHADFFQHFIRQTYSGNYGRLFQVPKRNDPYTSLSVFLSDNKFMMVRTGWPCIRGGRPDVNYVYPKELIYNR